MLKIDEIKNGRTNEAHSEEIALRAHSRSKTKAFAMQT